jgi:hypothetical protein
MVMGVSERCKDVSPSVEDTVVVISELFIDPLRALVLERVELVTPKLIDSLV